VNVERWIVVPNWDRFQHYSDRNPTWIKVYTELNSRDEWRNLPLAQRGVLVTIWLEYARSNGQLTVRHMCAIGPAMSTRYGHLYKHLEALNDAGFIRLSASRPLALARSREKRREEQEQHAPTRPKKPKPKTPAETRTNAAAYQPFDNPPPEAVEVDQATLELARKWLRPQ
jgi:hypothetical protein